MHQPRNLIAKSALAVVLLIGAIASCSSPTGSDPIVPVQDLAVSASDGTWASAGSLRYQSYSASATTDLRIKVDGLGAGDEAILIVTNEQEGVSFSFSGTLNDQASSRSLSDDEARAPLVDDGNRIIKDVPSISGFNSDPEPFLKRGSTARGVSGLSMPAIDYDVAGSTPSVQSLWAIKADSSGTQTPTQLPSTCRAVIGPFHGVTLNVWVADESWTDSAVAGKVTQAMVDAVADKFLKDSTDNDIYEWIGTLFGSEYGDDPFSSGYFIDDNDEITIFIANIMEQNSADGGTIGYFHGLNDYRNVALSSDLRYSNERVMFFIDAPMLANPKGGASDTVWDAADPWPIEIYSTLAHEFQHMIHFNERIVQRDLETETWLNELCSAIAEDYASNKLGAEGPRGVAYDTLGAGATGNTHGRFPLFIYLPEDSLTVWSGEDLDYSSAYAFGSWLVRNYGANGYLPGRIVGNSSTGFDSIVSAINVTTTGVTKRSLLRDWGLACLSSDDSSQPVPYSYNLGSTGYSQRKYGMTYALGSINLNNYQCNFEDGTYWAKGLYIWGNIPNQSAGPCSNTYIGLDSSDGTAEATLRLEPGMSVTVVLR